MIRNSVGVDIGFLTWMALAVPMLIVMAAALFLLLYRLHPETPPPGRAMATSAPAVGETSALGSDMRSHVEREKARLGPWTRGQANTLVAFGVAVALWMVPGVLAVFGLGDSRPEQLARDADAGSRSGGGRGAAAVRVAGAVA